MTRRTTMPLALAAALVSGACAQLIGIDKTYTETADAAGADAPTGPFCQTLDAASVVFCDDFDDDAGLGAKWTSTSVSKDNLLYLDKQGSVSPPASVAMALASTTLPFADLTNDLAASGQRVVLEAQVRLDSFADASASAIGVLSITAVETDGTWNADLFVTPSTLSLIETHWPADGGPSQDNPVTASNSFTLGTWTLTRLEVDLAARTMSLFLDGVLAATQAIMPGWPSSMAPRIVVGPFEYRSTVVQSVMHFDNVVVEVQ